MMEAICRLLLERNSLGTSTLPDGRASRIASQRGSAGATSSPGSPSWWPVTSEPRLVRPLGGGPRSVHKERLSGAGATRQGAAQGLQIFLPRREMTRSGVSFEEDHGMAASRRLLTLAALLLAEPALAAEVVRGT